MNCIARLVGERSGRSTTSKSHCASWLNVGENPRRPAAKPGGSNPLWGKAERAISVTPYPAVSDYGCQSRNAVHEKED